MTKTRSNDPCPCGSGKKYKKCCCHNPKSNYVKMPVDKLNPDQNTADLKVFGMRGFQQYIYRHFTYFDPKKAPGKLGGSPGKYSVTFLLNRPGFPLVEEYRLTTSQKLQGDSHVGITEPAVRFLQGDKYDRIALQCQTANGSFQFEGYPNENGFLGKLTCEDMEANDFSDASLRAHYALAPSLSAMSFVMDVPVNIYQIDVVEKETHNSRMSFLTPHFPVAFAANAIDVMSEDLQKYASLYREALNSNSPNYQYLCLYKVIEGLRERRSRIRKTLVLDAKSKGESVFRYSDERIPTNLTSQIEWLKSIFPQADTFDEMLLATIFLPEVLNRKVGNLIDKGQELHKLRNKIAHAVLDSGEITFSIDNGLNIDEVNKWLPITKCLVRYLILEGFPETFS